LLGVSQVPDKAGLVAELVAVLQTALEAARRAHEATAAGATHAEARAENSKDTRGLEQSYLARGQAQRVAELELGLARISALVVRAFERGESIAVGALVGLDEDGESQRVLVAPYGGGTTLTSGVQVVTPSSPFGGALLGKGTGDELEIQLPGRRRAFTVTSIA
jgi:transcription elongation GreA/GreB family factor